MYRRNKYNAKKIEVDGEKFDSRKEYFRYLELKELEEAGKITDLKRQVKFVLFPKQKVPDTGEAVREAYYMADFTYFEDGKYIVEDVKGYTRSKAYDYFMLKKKAMLEKYGIWIKEV